MVSSQCPGREQLVAFTLGELPEESIDTITAHLDCCPACESIAATLDQASDTLVSQLRGPLHESQVAHDPECQRVLAQLKAIAPWQDARGREDGEAFSDEEVPDLPQVTQPDAPPTALGEYVLLEKLGDGGMGVVYKARHKNLGRTVALKVVARGHEGDDRALARFQREMLAVGRLDHPNIVQAHDAREIGGTWFLVMQYVEGSNLAQLAKRCGPLGIADACEVAHQAALALQFAHEHGLVHRDIKPSNLILTPQGSVKVLDLGLALLREELTAPGDGTTEEGEVTRDGDVMGLPSSAAAADDLTGTQVVGTCDYMAPEQTRNAHEVDIRADIYSLGCTLYKLLSGHAPFGGHEYDTAASKLAAHAHAPVPPIRQQRAEVPEELTAIVARMLAKDPAERFATPADVAEALQPWTAGSDLASLVTGVVPEQKAEATTPASRMALPPRRRRRLALAVAGAAAIVLLGVLLTVSTGKGTVHLEFADAEAARQCTISIDGDEIRVENLGEPVKLRPGKHQLRLMHGDLEIETREFTVLRHGNQVLYVSAQALARGVAAGEAQVVHRARLPAGPEGSPIRWLGFETYGPANVPVEVAPYTNIVFIRGWLGGKWSVEGSDGILQAARTAGLTVILAFHSKERHRIEEPISPVLRKNRDVIAAVCWEEPYYANYRPSDVSEFGQWLRREFPRCEYWVSFVNRPRGREQTWPVPADVHVIIVNQYGGITPEAVRSTADELLPNWIDKAKNRPVVLRWVPNSSNYGQPDALINCEPGTVRMFAQVAKDYGLAGVILSRYGDFWKPSHIGIDARPVVLAETKEVAQNLGFTKDGSPDLSVQKRPEEPPASELGDHVDDQPQKAKLPATRKTTKQGSENSDPVAAELRATDNKAPLADPRPAKTKSGQRAHATKHNSSRASGLWNPKTLVLVLNA
jgi:serine/threonine protein kinase